MLLKSLEEISIPSQLQLASLSLQFDSQQSSCFLSICRVPPYRELFNQLSPLVGAKKQQLRLLWSSISGGYIISDFLKLVMGDFASDPAHCFGDALPPSYIFSAAPRWNRTHSRGFSVPCSPCNWLYFLAWAIVWSQQENKMRELRWRCLSPSPCAWQAANLAWAGTPSWDNGGSRDLNPSIPPQVCKAGALRKSELCIIFFWTEIIYTTLLFLSEMLFGHWMLIWQSIDYIGIIFEIFKECKFLPLFSHFLQSTDGFFFLEFHL